MPKAILTFAVYKAGQLVRHESVDHDIVKVGRDPKSHLRVDDEAASRMHAVIEVASPSELTLIDLGNEHGTFVNGQRINKSRLVLGDRIDVGAVQLVLENVEAPAPERFERRPSAPQAVVPGQPRLPSAAAAGASLSAPAQAAPAPRAPAPPGPSVRPRPQSEPDTSGYAMIKSGPDVSPDEVELPHVQAVEVVVLWGTNVLHIAHLSPPRGFYVGETQTKANACDFFLPREKLGASSMPVVLAEGGGIQVVLPAGATGQFDMPDGTCLSLDQIRPRAKPSGHVPGAHEVPLAPGARARVELGDIVFQVAAVNAGKPIAHGLAGSVDWNIAAYFLMTFLSVGGFLAAMAFFVPPLGLSDDEGIDQDQLYLIQQYLNAAAERELEEEETEDADDGEQEGGTGDRAQDEEGQMGKESSQESNNRYAVEGPEDNPDPHLARKAAIREAMEFGIIGLLNSGAAGDPDAPVSPFGRDTSLGTDATSAMGNMWGEDIGEAFGGGGLGLSGTGEGGGGKGVGIGLGSIGTLGHGSGTGSGQGMGSGRGRLQRSHRAKAPRLRMGKTTVSGRLPPEVIRRIVRQNFGRFRLCYEKGLSRNPNLEGRVSVRFVIGSNGAVSNASNGGSDLPDSSVVQCVVKQFYGISFPKPEGGIVRVTYPIMLSPAG